MGLAASKSVNSLGAQLRYAKDKGQQLISEQRPRSPLVADSPGPVGAAESRLAGELGKLDGDPAEELQRDPVMGKLLDQLGGSIAKRPSDARKPAAIPGLPRFNKPGEAAHRLDLAVLKGVLLDSRSEKFSSKAASSTEALANEYGVDAAVLAEVLRHNAVPVYREAEDGRVFGSWT